MISSAVVCATWPAVTVAVPSIAIATWPVTSSPVNVMSRTWAGGLAAGAPGDEGDAAGDADLGGRGAAGAVPVAAASMTGGRISATGVTLSAAGATGAAGAAAGDAAASRAVAAALRAWI